MGGRDMLCKDEYRADFGYWVALFHARYLYTPLTNMEECRPPWLTIRYYPPSP